MWHVGFPRPRRRFPLQPYVPTIDDTYTVQADLEKGAKETLVFHDTAGLDSTNHELKKCYIAAADVSCL